MKVWDTVKRFPVINAGYTIVMVVKTAFQQHLFDQQLFFTTIESLLQPFCSAGRISLLSRKLSFLSVIMDVNSLYVVDRHVAGL